MRSYSHALLVVAVLMAGGCQSQRAPEFVLNSQTKALVPAAQDAVRNELQSAFGTPTKLTVWESLPVDFGKFEGKVTSVSDGRAFVKLAVASPNAAARRLPEMKGAAVKIKGADSGLVVASYNAETGALGTTGSDAAVLTADADVSVIGDGLQFGRDLYLRHCMHCHGVSGDGDGPTAKYFAVRPRDYRKGTFKFTSTKPTIRPSRDDIKRIIKLGVPGTYMPSFMLLPDDEVIAIGEYVRWLAMRGELENKLDVELGNDYSPDAAKDRQLKEVKQEIESKLSGKVTEFGTELTEDWNNAEDEGNVVTPVTARVPSDADSIERGRKLFISDKVKCFSCHGETGRGNGVSTEDFNDIPGGKPGEKSKVAGLFDIWGNVVKPRDLTTGIYRGGRRPVDIYRRIAAGIKGTPMQAFGGSLKDEEIWDITNYVFSLPYQNKPAAKHH